MSVAAKLQIKPGQSVSVIGRPDDVALDVDASSPEATNPAAADVVIVFCTNSADLELHGAPLVAAARRDALTWIAYPKAGKLGTDLNRDSLRSALAADRVRPVRQIAIDDVWSALRLRPG